MQKIWPGSGKNPYKDQNLWDNEWQQHGSCLYAYDDRLNYFKSAIEVYDALSPDMDLIDKQCKAKLTTGNQNKDWITCSVILSANKKRFTGVRKAS
jgi:ribonuclease I